MSIKLVQSESNDIPTKPHFLLTYNYMIGDADGDTSESVELSIDNPFIERYLTILGKLAAPKGRWGLIYDIEHIYICFNEEQITEDEYNFICKLMFGRINNGYVLESKIEDHLYEFEDGVCSEIGHSFAVAQGKNLEYVDERGIKHPTDYTDDGSVERKLTL